LKSTETSCAAAPPAAIGPWSYAGGSIRLAPPWPCGSGRERLTKAEPRTSGWGEGCRAERKAIRSTGWQKARISGERAA
jgi:hypothetical protein